MQTRSVAETGMLGERLLDGWMSLGILGNLVRLWDFYFDGNQLVEMPASFPPLLNGIKDWNSVIPV